MPPSAAGQAGQAWLESYYLAEQYFRVHGDLLIPGSYICQGKRLGAWIAAQRADYRKRTNPRFTQERIGRLNAIGMVWDLKQFRWHSMCKELERYLRCHGTAQVPQAYVTPEGAKLGTWLNKARMDFKRDRLPKERQAQLEELGVVWAPETLRRGNWDRRFALLQAYVARNGTFPPATYITETGVKLGAWLFNQKQQAKAGSLLPARRQQLEALGIVWDVLEDGWLARYRQAQAYYLSHGHLCPYQKRGAKLPEGLSQWLSAQRKARQAGTLTAEKIQMLESTGMAWDVYSHLWDSSYRLAEAYYLRHGHLRIPKDNGPDTLLGRWISTQRSRRREGKLSSERIQKLDEIGMVWDARTDSESLWESWFKQASAYYARHGHLSPQGGKLRTWILTQRAAKKGKRGCLSDEQIRRLEQIGMAWEPLSDRWLAMYQHAKEYHRVHQMLNIPCNYVTETGARLGSWIAHQRRCYKNYLAGNTGQGRGSITPEHIALLNELGMVWDGTLTAPGTSFQEKALLFYLKKSFPDAAKLPQWQELGVELDLYIPSIRTAIEYDGLQWHGNRLEQDEKKGQICRDHGIRLIRLREPGLPQVSHCALVIWLDGQDSRALEDAISRLFRYLALPCPTLDITRDRPAILETYRDFTARAWDLAYQAAYRYYSSHGSLSIPAGLTSSSGTNLAVWINSQRSAYRNNELTALQAEKLEALGMRWAPFEEQWQRMYQLAASYARACGNLLVPCCYVTGQGVRLGAWLSHQRELHRRKALSPRRANLLEQLGILWEPSRQENYLAAAEAYRRDTGGLDVPACYATKDGLRLGKWLRKQQRRYQAGTLGRRRIHELEKLGIHWDASRPRWEEMFSLAQDYYHEHGNLWLSPRYVTAEGQKLGQWVARQRQKLHGKHGCGKLTGDQKRRLDGIGMVWEPYTEKWMKKYRLAKAFYLAHGHLGVPVGFITEDGVKLGMWLSSQRQAMRGNPNFLMTPERKRLLDAIGMDWYPQHTASDACRQP